MAASDSEQNVNSEAEQVIIHEIPLCEYAKSISRRQQQSNDSDCGVFAIAFARSLVYTMDRWIQISHDFIMY
jgi:Ulp1 family protease